MKESLGRMEQIDRAESTRNWRAKMEDPSIVRTGSESSPVKEKLS